MYSIFSEKVKRQMCRWCIWDENVICIVHVLEYLVRHFSYAQTPVVVWVINGHEEEIVVVKALCFSKTAIYPSSELRVRITICV